MIYYSFNRHQVDQPNPSKNNKEYHKGIKWDQWCKLILETLYQLGKGSKK